MLSTSSSFSSDSRLDLTLAPCIPIKVDRSLDQADVKCLISSMTAASYNSKLAEAEAYMANSEIHMISNDYSLSQEDGYA